MIYKRVNNKAKGAVSVRKWKHKLQDQPVFIIGNAPSLNDVENIHILDPYFSIGINRPHLKDNFDPTILMWQDVELWKTEKYILPKLGAIKFARRAADPMNLAYHFSLQGGNYKLPKITHILHGYGSSVPLAFELSWCLGCDPIIFLGYDCCYRGEKTDFYGKNKDHKSHTLSNCMKGMLWVAGAQKERQIINCSDNDVLGPRRELEEVVEEVKDKYKGTGREYFKNLLENN